MHKNLGQHFLNSETAIRAIVTALGPSNKDTVVEVGPGTGAITKPLLKCAKNVIAIEKDQKLAENLVEQTPDSKLKVIHGDIRDFKPSELELKDYLLVGNIPYYITGRILRIVLSSSPQPKRVVFVVQKEVAERIVAKDKKESILSMSVKAYGEPKYIKTLKRGSFNPPPRVDSAILQIDSISKDFFSDFNENNFFSLVKKGFAHKRKTLRNNLNVDEETLSLCAIMPNERAEKISLNQWMCLAMALEKEKSRA